jgi:hypothetical protein
MNTRDNITIYKQKINSNRILRIVLKKLPFLDLESMIVSKMSKNIDGDWQCNDCFKTSKVKTNIFEHIEANHVDSPGYQCELCYKFCRTRNALRNHKNFKHKQIKNVY